MRAWAPVSLGALLASPAWATGLAWPVATATSESASNDPPLWDNRSRTDPAVSAGRTGSVRVPTMSPVSIPSSRTNVVAPIIESPAMSARCTGAAPRHCGSNEKCRLIHPCSKTSSTGRGSRAP